MTKDDLKKVLIARFKEEVSITEEMISTVVESMAGDIETIMANKKAEYTISIWDKESSINGVDASYVLNQYPYTLPGWNGITYLINKGNKTIVIQQDNYETQGWDPILTEEEAMRLAQIHLDGIVEKLVLENIIMYIRG